MTIQTMLNTPTSAAITCTTTNDNAAAGKLGEFISSTVLQGSAVSLSNGTDTNVTSISLTAGDWDVWGNVWFLPGGSTVTTAVASAINNVSAVRPTPPGNGASVVLQTALGTGAITQGQFTGQTRFSLSTTTTIYLIANASFTVDVMSAYGFIGARRVR